MLMSCDLVSGNHVWAKQLVEPGADDAVALIEVETTYECLTTGMKIRNYLYRTREPYLEDVCLDIHGCTESDGLGWMKTKAFWKFVL